jgi:hypothetical protein
MDTLGIGRRLHYTAVHCPVDEIRLPAFEYAAVVRVCPRTKTGEGTFVGPWASYIVQRLTYGGSTFLLLDTSHYLSPVVVTVGRHGELGSDQTDDAAALVAGIERQRVIVTGHHSLNYLPGDEQEWVAERGARYLSGHTHTSSVLLRRDVGPGLVELNIGSIIDFPAQAVLMRTGPSGASFRVAGADTTLTKWAGFVQPCEDRRAAWALATSEYQNYRTGSYAADLIRALGFAKARAPELVTAAIPMGDQPGDWGRLSRTLADIRSTTGEARQFWGCQAYYASEATRSEKTRFEAVLSSGIGGVSALGQWYRLDPPASR